MPPKKRTTKKETAPAQPPVEMNTPAPAAKKPAKSRAPKVAASAAPKPKVETLTKAAQPVEVQVPIAVETPIAAEAPEQPARPAISVEDIRHAAFYLSQRRRGPGDPVADWFEAERLLVARSA